MQANDFLRHEKCFMGIYDFSYAPYALGDAFTWQVNLCVKALEKGTHKVLQCLMVDSARPSFPLQTYITTVNYRDYINNLFPAFLCSPLLSSIKIFTNRKAFNLFLVDKTLKRQAMWPGIFGHAMEKLDYYSHEAINRFYRKHHYIPRLKTPCGYEQAMDDFFHDHCNGRFVVAVNIRQRAYYANFGFEKCGSTSVRRDSPLDEWYRFFKVVNKKYPDVLFLIFGGYSEWEKELYGYENVLIPRSMGYQLAHELALFHKSHLFMGTSSGFSALATFSEIPYIITNFDHAAAQYVDIPVGARNYPFALNHQILSWEKESTELLLGLFMPMYQLLHN
jgi:hypothetical protein